MWVDLVAVFAVLNSVVSLVSAGAGPGYTADSTHKSTTVENVAQSEQRPTEQVLSLQNVFGDRADGIFAMDYDEVSNMSGEQWRNFSCHSMEHGGKGSFTPPSLVEVMSQHGGIPGKLIRLIKALYDGFQCAIIDENKTTEWLNINTGVKQGCNMSGFLFLLVIDWIMKNTVGNGENGIRWKFMSKLDDLDFSDDIALLSSTQQHLQQKTDNLVLLSQRTGLRVNPEKCNTLRIYEKSTDKIRVDNATLEDVETFHYLGAVVSKIGGGSKNLQNRLTKARSFFCRLGKLWSSTSASQHTKIKLYKTLVMSVLMYGCETWSMTKGDENKMDVFQSRCLRQILRVKWSDRITNSKDLETARMETISGIIRKRRWKYIGHNFFGRRQTATALQL
ncbi:retrovirus-related Pol polyprotein from type-2 retrotransposable element R2DM [Elysia marginata]|uniref:Retrovirus-related Pol polyprotein from type-2 retrotransposable element R2DM n=1 Tax=Elysia marginata TaxID=1093978 RepID=A0AAV4EUS0_9GAST|nr:retrovirus-related Pol polyprotein from type-2 retrotransposable element R2DM [Elysia marginata]